MKNAYDAFNKLAITLKATLRQLKCCRVAAFRQERRLAISSWFCNLLFGEILNSREPTTVHDCIVDLCACLSGYHQIF